MSQRIWNCEELYKAYDQNVTVIAYKNTQLWANHYTNLHNFLAYAMIFYYGYDLDVHATLVT